jgi:hypothetical protein
MELEEREEIVDASESEEHEDFEDLDFEDESEQSISLPDGPPLQRLLRSGERERCLCLP